MAKKRSNSEPAAPLSEREEAFLQAILEEPGVDAHRLVYADWLAEQDDPRAELVRLAVHLGEVESGDSCWDTLEKRRKELEVRCDGWWAAKILAPSQVRRLRRLMESRFGSLDTLYTRELHNFRCLHPVTTRKAVQEAEAELGFALPPLLGLAYTTIGNGGLLLTLIGLPGGQKAFDDIGFEGKNLVESYRTCLSFGRWRGMDEEADPWPRGLVPIYDGSGCGMVEYVDCTTPEGALWRMDSGELSRLRSTLETYWTSTLTKWTLR